MQIEPQRTRALIIPLALCALMVPLSIGRIAYGEEGDRPKASLIAGGGARKKKTIAEYAELVRQELGPIPSFRPLDAGKEIPVTVDGKRVGPNELAGAAGVDCPPFLQERYLRLKRDRIGRLPGVNPKTGQPDPDIQWFFYCCQSDREEGVADPRFESMGLIGHHRVTGATAFFDADPSQKSTRVPSPMEPESETPAGFPTAAQYWNTASSVASRNCHLCHTVAPFVHSPYIDQVKTTDETGKETTLLFKNGDVDSRYWFIGEEFKSWEPARYVAPANNKCVMCHRIGVTDNYKQYVKWVTGQEAPPSVTASHTSYPHCISQPPGASEKLPREKWDSKFQASVKQLLDCIQNPSNPDCNCATVPGKAAQ